MDKKGQKRTYKEEVLTLNEVASYLKISEKTVLRMIRDRKIPCAKVAGQWRFLSAVIDDWLLSKMKVVPRNDLGRMVENDYSGIQISRLVRPEFIVMDLKPGQKRNVLEQLAGPFVRNGIIAETDKFIDRLEIRERMVSTAVGRGIAIPHVRKPDDNPMGGPFLCIGICRAGTDFESLDGKPTQLFFLVYTDSEVVHLRVMAKLTGLLRKEETVRRIIHASGPQEVLSTVVKEDQRGIVNCPSS